MTLPASRHSSWKIIAGVVGLLLLHAGLALWAVAGKSVTVDELFHITGGYFYDKYGDYRVHPDNGVLPQRLHALPAVLAGAKPPPLEGSEYWDKSDIGVVGHQFFYESGNDHWPMLMGARMVNLMFSLGICLLVFGWARALAGPAAGLVALAFAVCSPTLLAHGPLATTDAAAACFLTASAGAFWWQLRTGGWRRTVLSGIVFGLACVTKYSAALLLPVFAVLLAVHLVMAPPEQRRTGPVLFGLVVHVLAAFVIIWACYGFRYTGFSPALPAGARFIRDWSWMLDRAGWQGPVIAAMRDLRLFPEAFLFGYVHTYVGSMTRAAFLAGEFSNTGWRTFFPLAFWWKSTPAELAGLGLAAVAAGWHWRRLREWMLRLAPLLALAAVYGVVAVNTRLNIGHRHLLPLYPALFIVAAVAVMRITANPRVRLALAGLLVMVQVTEAGRIFPDYLAYFNACAGGPGNGWQLLVDSSLDWGQDLSGLDKWLRKNNSGPGAQPVFLSYFGSGEPAYYGIQAHRLPFVNNFKFSPRGYEPAAGIYCVSATMLQQVYSPERGAWTVEKEREYQALRAKEPLFREYWHNQTLQQEVRATGAGDAFEKTWEHYDLLRFARLCHYLRARHPDAVIGYSIFIYRLTDAEVAAVLDRNYSDWLRAVEQAGRS